MNLYCQNYLTYFPASAEGLHVRATRRINPARSRASENPKTTLSARFLTDFRLSASRKLPAFFFLNELSRRCGRRLSPLGGVDEKLCFEA